MQEDIFMSEELGIRKFERIFNGIKVVDDAYYVSYNGAIYNDRIIAKNLNIPLETYNSILINHGAKILNEDNNLYFDNENDVIEAIESIYTMLKLSGNDKMILNKIVQLARLEGYC